MNGDPLAATLLDHPSVSARAFYPRRTHLEPNLVVDVGDAALACHLHRLHPRAGMVIHFHGNGELAAEYSADHADLFVDLGLNVCFAEYRGYGRSSGRPALAAMRGDGERVMRALDCDPRRTVAFGRSLGSLYAVELAARVPELAGIVIESGIATLPRRWLEPEGWSELGGCGEQLAAEAAATFDQQRKLAGFRGAVLVLHAAGDHLLDRTHAERLHAWSGSAAKRLVVFPAGDHNTIFQANHAAYVRELSTYLNALGLADERPPAFPDD